MARKSVDETWKGEKEAFSEGIPKETKKLDLTKGGILKNLIIFSIPFLISSFLQTFYGLADLFIAGQFYGATTITAVSIGSQLMHMITVIIVGLSMGTTVVIGHCIGAGKKNTELKQIVGNSFLLFEGISVALILVLFLCADGICSLLFTPAEALAETKSYLFICIVGTLFITGYNVLSGIFRGLGDSKSPMYFVALSGVINLVLDYVLMGPARLGAAGAAIATVSAQAISLILGLIYARIKYECFHISKSHLKLSTVSVKKILGIGIPVALQDGFIQISFLVITAIANMRGLDTAAAVGIVEKIISFLFLVPSAMLSAVSAIAAQNAGANQHQRGAKTLGYGIAICVLVGILFTILCEWRADALITLFSQEEPQVVALGAQYLRAYVFDCIVAGIHFCFSGYFCAYGKSYLSFIHNLLSILLIRIPGSYLAYCYFPESLFPMGLAAPMGSLLSAVICTVAYLCIRKKI